MITCLRRIAPADLEPVLPALTALLQDAVDGGASLGFHAPLSADDARQYWLSLRPEMYAGTRILLAASVDGCVVGSGQLALASAPNARHRAMVQKLCVLTVARGCGIGRTLMAALHDQARHHGRDLVLLSTRRGDPAERFYKQLGYRDAGIIPRYTVGPDGERYDSVTLYQELVPLAAVAAHRAHIFA